MLKTIGILAFAAGTCGSPSDGEQRAEEPDIYVSIEELPDGGVRTVETPMEPRGMMDRVMEGIASLPFVETVDGLAGQPVALSVHCCTAPPTDANLISEELEGTVGDGVEFSSIDSSGPSVIGASIDLSAYEIVIEYTSALAASGGAFNGYVFRFDDRLASIAVVSEESTVPEGSVTATMSNDDREIHVNVSGLRTTVGMRIVIELQTLTGGGIRG